MLLSIFRISGHSMQPYLNPGGYVIVSSIPYFLTGPRTGDVVVFRYNNKMLIKRIVRIENEKYYLEGDNKSDNLKIEPIERAEILGKIILSLKS